jgi:beta-glucosidase
LRVSAGKIKPGGSVTVDVTVANEGKAAGEETVLLFVRDPVASVSRPVLELKGMAKVALKPGERRAVRLTLATDALTFPGPDLEPRFEPGVFELFVGPAAREEVLLTASFQLVAG